MHTPEFDFEKDIDNVRNAAEENGLGWLIVQDNDYSTWRFFNNRYWPAKYIFDTSGNLRFQHFGEGKYAETEQVIRLLLDEAGYDISGIEPTVSVAAKECAPDIRGKQIKHKWQGFPVDFAARISRKSILEGS